MRSPTVPTNATVSTTILSVSGADVDTKRCAKIRKTMAITNAWAWVTSRSCAGRLRKDHDVAALAPAIERGDRRRRHADPSDLEPELRRESDGGQHQEAGVDEAQAPWRTLE